MLPKTSKLPAAALLQLIEEARNAELCRDIDTLRNILQTVWDSHDCSPTFAEYEPAIRAELLRLCGFFLTFSGRSRNLKDHQLRAKDVLTNAIEIFQSEGLADKAAESKIILAFCYWNGGEVQECEALLGLVENDFSENKLHPVYLQLQINRLLIYYWGGNFLEGQKLIDKISDSMEFCKDIRLRIMFHSESGVIYQYLKNFTDSKFHFLEAIRLATKFHNRRFVASNLNNLALLHRDIKDFDEAHSLADKSLKIYSTLGDKGWIPHVLDTKALIYLDENRYTEALETVEDALTYFFDGEDYNGLTNALWTKILCLLRLGFPEEALITFTELKNIASGHVGEVAVRKFVRNFSDEIYVLKQLPLSDEVAAFKKARISAALIETKGAVGKAAELLGYKNHQALSDALNKQFPELLGDLGFKRRARRSLPAGISKFAVTGKRFSFDFKMPTDRFSVFYFDQNSMKIFGIKSGAIVAVIPPVKLGTGKFVLVSDGKGFAVGRIEYDDWAEIFFISDKKGNPIPIDEANIVGEPVGFCSFHDAKKKQIRFSRLT